jgi:heme A synthase
MVGPSLTDEEREGKALQLKVGFALVVAASGGLIGFYAGGDPLIVGGGLLGGAVLGAALVWYLSWLGTQARRKARGRSRRPTRGDGDGRDRNRDRRR